MSGKLTPLLRQYLDIKAKYSDCLIFFRLGDFYELFFEDAEVSAKVLGITLTKRGQVEGKDIPMCGVPFHQGENYLSKLLKAGYKVAICEQTETPEESKKRGYKAIIERKVVRVATPGTLTEEIELGDTNNNYLMALIAVDKSYGAAWVDISTGEVSCINCEDINDLLETCLNKSPSEILVANNLFEKNYLTSIPKNHSVTFYDLETKDLTKTKNSIINFYKKEKEFNVDNFSTSERLALHLILEYVLFTQNGLIPYLKIPDKVTKKNFLEIDNATKRNLEIVNTLNGDIEGSLFHSVDYTFTSSGKRRLRNDLENPLYSFQKINERLNLVEFFFDNYNFINLSLNEKLKKIPDIARSSNRLSLNRGSPRDLLSIMQGLIKVNELITDILSRAKEENYLTAFNSLIKKIHKNESIIKIVSELKNALKENISIQNKEGNFIKEGYDEELDKIRTMRDDSRSLILEIEQKEKLQTGINGLKIKYNNFLGYFIDLSGVNHKLLKNENQQYIHRQTLKNSYRYTTKELIEVSEKILNANFLFSKKENEIYKNLISIIKTNARLIASTSDVIARIDVAQSWANYSIKYNAVRPTLLQNKDFTIIDGRHPAVEKSHSTKFISNSCILKEEDNKFFKLITGPNMSGKSTYLRQNAIILIMAQAGGFCPAKEVTLGVCDKLFCRVGSGDELAKGNSTFMVEMLETANILNSATDKSLVILDEIGRGTSTFDGISIAWATSEYLLEKIKCKVLFATHYNELSNLEKKYKGLDLNTFRVKEWKGELIFLYEIIRGLAESSYGIQVGKMAGLPKEVTDLAFNILSKLEQKDYNFFDNTDQLNIAFKKENISDQSHLEKTINLIKSIDINNIRPIEALQKLEDLQKEIRNQDDE
jgi:DNA mismatch repair protein MutS